MYIDQPFTVRSLTLRNRIVMPPMCMFSSDGTGRVRDFHRLHYGARAVGGAGLVIEEATAVSREGRISDADLGIWEDGQIDGLRELARLIHAGGAAAGIQLAHAGRKCGSGDDPILAPSAIPFDDKSRMPREMDAADIAGVVSAFRDGAARALAAGFDLIEIHAAHGYLLHEFLSPLSNRRTDGYGGDTDGRVRLLLEVLDAVRTVWPEDRPLEVRLSASDYLEGGLDIAETIRIVDRTRSRADLFHISSGGILPAPIRTFPGYQTVFSGAVRASCGVPTIAVGLITSFEQAEETIAQGRADLVALGRELLRDPYWPLRQKLAHPELAIETPKPYGRGFHIG
ncbi:MAG: NADPH dehydrogenase NamA [Clostridia bacterium]|nr:NADPH dehydrogenase NamA [Clostridia bacterium]